MLFEIGNIPASSALGIKAEQSISNRTVRGLTVRVDVPATVDKTSIQVELQAAGQENVIIIPEMSLYPFFERADIGFGCGFGDALTEQALAATGSGATVDIPAVAAFIDLGCVVLKGDDKLIVRLKVATAYGASDGLNVCGVDIGPGTERILRFSDKPAGDATFTDAEEVFLYRTSGDAADQQLSSLVLGQCTVNMRTPNGSFNADARSFWDHTRATGRIEANGTRRTAVLYTDKEVLAPGGMVSVVLNGSQRANYSILGVERYTNAKRAAASKNATSAELQARLVTVRATMPDKLNALQIAGFVPAGA